MNDRSSAKLRMYKQLLEVCNSYKASWKALLAFERNVLGLAGEVESINKLNAGLQGGSGGHTQSKEESLEDMIFSALTISYALRAYAKEKKLTEMYDDVNIERTDFLRAKETDRDDIALHIHEWATKHLPALAEFGIAQAELDELAVKIEDFSAKIGQPRTIIRGLKVSRQVQQQHFDNADRFINEGLDNLIYPFQKKDKKFYEAYQSARSVIRSGARATEKNVEEPA